MARDDIDNQKLVTVGVIFAVLVFAIVVSLQAFYYHLERAQLNIKVVEPMNAQLRSLQNKQEAMLHAYRVVDAKKKIVAIPIERAMELMVEEQAKFAPPEKEKK